MAQHDLDIANGSGSTVRADINSALAALGSLMKGASAPSAPTAGMLWLEDDTPSSSVWRLRIYDGADWSAVGTFDSNTNTFIGTGGLIQTQIFSTPGTATYTAHACTRRVIVRVQGAGGGSGGVVATTAADWAAGRGGGGGAYAEKLITSSFDGVTVTVGAGGAGGSAGDNAGATGGTSSFGALVSCAGGSGGAGSGAASSSLGFAISAANGGTATGGDINIPGGTADLSFALAVATAYRAPGGTSMLGIPGAPFAVGSGSLAGITPTGYGGGASGPVNAGAILSAAAGVAGAQGIVIVYEFG